MQRIPFDELVEFGVRLLVKKGVAEEDARYVAGIAVRTEAMGVTTHGLALLGYFDKAVGKAIDAKAKPIVEKEKAASALINGNRSFGQLAMRLAVEIASKKAREHGVAMVGVRNTSWLGALGVYLLPLANDGLMAQLWAQTSTCKDCAPIGGLDAKFSTNPVALAFPTGNGPMVADFSTAAVAMGKVGQLIRLGKKAEEAIFMDKEGNLTDDPKAVKEGGSILFTGGEGQGHKGYALSLWCEALTALAGGDCNNPGAESRQTFNLTVVDPDAFAGNDYYLKEMKRFVGHVKNSRLRPGFDAIRLPGERAVGNLVEAEERGVPVEDFMLERLNSIAEANGIGAPGGAT